MQLQNIEKGKGWQTGSGREQRALASVEEPVQRGIDVRWRLMTRSLGLGHDDALRIEREDQLIVSYPCVYDPPQRRIISVDEGGRQQYRRFQILQLKLFTLGMVRWVWCLPRYRRSRGPRRGFRRLQLNLFERFAK